MVVLLVRSTVLVVVTIVAIVVIVIIVDVHRVAVLDFVFGFVAISSST